MPSSFRFFSIILLRAREARSSADIAQPMMKFGVHDVKGEAKEPPPQMGIKMLDSLKAFFCYPLFLSCMRVVVCDLT